MALPMWLSLIQSLEYLNGTKRWEKADFVLCLTLSWDVSLLVPSLFLVLSPSDLD